MTDRAARSARERRVLDLVEALLEELGSTPSRPVTLRASLARDLGVGSLERVELLLRLEQEFGVRLPDAVMADAESPHDLVRALERAAPAAPEPTPEVRPAIEPGIAAPADARTLDHVLHWHAEAHPDRVQALLREEDGRETPITYGALRDGAAAVAAGLRARDFGGGERIALMLRTERAFFEAFFGVLLAGGVPVPIYPPFRLDRLEEYAARQAGILTNAEASLLVTFPAATGVARLLRERVPSLRGGVTTVERLAGERAPGAPPRHAQEDAALIQYTSGSTGAPKGVLLTHANVLANIRAIGEAIDIRPDDIGVSWLPLYHDMGLIGTWLTALYFGIPIVILSPLAFLSRPARWLRAIHAHRATLSPAPNFAFDLCVAKVPDADLQGLDLASWRLAFNGSEPVSPDSLERFLRRFAPYGFRGAAMCPVYGLAESTVALTVPPPGRGPWIDRVERAAFERRREARPAAPDDASALRFVSCGRALSGHAVRVVDGAGRPLGERREGRIEFRGPSVSGGYFRNPEATRAARRGDWMDSGDLGYLAEGELFVTGREKDVIIKGGRNLYPHEVEEVVGDLPGIRKGCVAAFGVPAAETGTERLVVVAESRERAPARVETLRAAVLDRVVTALGVPADTVVIARPGAVLKTSSGKIRRAATRDAYLRGETARGRAGVGLQWVRLGLGWAVARAARLARQAARLIYAAYVGALSGPTLLVLWGLVLVLPARAADRLTRLWSRAILLAVGCPTRVEGLEHLDAAVPAILAPNHASYIDAVVLLATLPVEFVFVAKRELIGSPVVGAVIEKVGHLTVERADPTEAAADAERATQRLRAGVSLVVFPEGTFARPPGLLPFRLGAFKSAVETRRPVVPIGLRGTRAILPADTLLPTPGPIRVVIGPPLTPRGDGWPEMVRLRDLARAEIARLADERPVGRAPA